MKIAIVGQCALAVSELRSVELPEEKRVVAVDKRNPFDPEPMMITAKPNIPIPFIPKIPKSHKRPYKYHK